jgi:hypothetical protein
MKVIATDRGYWDQIREPGDEFEVPDDTKPAKWFETVDKPAKKPTKPKDDKNDDSLA